MIKYQRFRREYMSWRMSQLSEVRDLNEITELPYGSILHVLDNFPWDGKVSWGPRPDNYFINMNRFRLYMNNLIMWPKPSTTDVAPIYKDKLLLMNAGVVAGIAKYRRDMMPRVKYIEDLKQAPLIASTSTIVNYNPLFRMRALGLRKKVRFFNFLLACLVNKLMEDKEKQHFIHIPLEPFIYEKKHFIRTLKKYDKIATMFPDRSTYLFLAHFYGIVAKSVSMPKRGMPSKTELDEDGSQEAFSVDIDTTYQIQDALEGNEDWFTNLKFEGMYDAAMEGLKEGENPYTLSIFEYIPAKMYEKINFIFTIGSHYICYNLRDIKELNGKANVGLLRIIAGINNLIRSSNEAANEEEVEETQTVPESVSEIDETRTGGGNTTTFTKPLTYQEKIDAAEIDMLEIDDISSILKEMPKETTTKQKEHVVKLSKAYKDLKIDGIKFDKVLTGFDDDALKPPEVDTTSTKDGSLAKEATKSSVSVFNKTYVETQLNRDLAAICTSFNQKGMFLTDFSETREADELSDWVTYKAVYEDTAHKKHTIKIPLPKINERGFTKINGTIKAMRAQRVSKPICKVSATRVTINSNYNKALIERNTNVARSFMSWFSRRALYKINSSDVGIKLTPSIGGMTYPVKALPFEYTELGGKYNFIKISGKKNGIIWFQLDKFPDGMPKGSIEKVEPLVKSGVGLWFGYTSEQSGLGEHFFISNDGLITVKNLDTDEESFSGAFADFIEYLTGVQLQSPVEYLEITYLSRTVPLIHMLAYKYGLTNMLKYCKADYSIYDVETRVDTRPSDIVIKFKDKKIVLNRTPRSNALLFGGLTAFDLSDVYYEDMDDPDVYYTLLEQIHVRMTFIKGVNAFFSLFIDPITRDVLREMREPTDIRDLLLRATTLLSTSDHLDPASEVNFRYRTVEQMTAIVYNEMARAFADYKNQSVGSTKRFSVNSLAIKQRIIQDQNMESVYTINPMEDIIKSQSGITNAGSGGRSNDTFKLNDRKFTKDAIGIMSEATTDNGKVGMNAILPANPIMTNSRGMTEHVDPKDLQPENILSFNTLLMPGVTQDDGKRVNFSSIQASAVVPINGSEVNRVRTGFEELVAHRTRPPFAYVAEEDGVIQNVDPKAGVLVVKYKSGKKTCVNFGEEYSNNTANGFFVNQDVVINGFKRGDTVRKGDVLTYNQQFFQPDPYDKKTVRYKLGVQAHVAILDSGGTIEDASIITKPLGDRMVFNPVHRVEVVITSDTNVRSFAHIGDDVNSVDPIIVFDESPFDAESEDDPELVEMLSRLNSTSKKAGHTGKIVKIEAYYKSAISTMSPSLQKLIKHAIEKRNLQADIALGCSNSDDYMKSKPLSSTEKLGLTMMEDDTVLLRFYIKQTKGMSPGDKLFFGPSLKSTVSQVYPESIETEDGSVKVDACTSGRGILHRMVFSPFLVGIANRVLEKTEKDILAIWDEK